MRHGNASGLTGITAVLLGGLLLSTSCDRILYPLRPFDHSTATLLGTVTDSLSHAPLTAAMVRITESGGSAFTDSNGTFRMSGIPTGEATLSVSAPGYETLLKTMDITLAPETQLLVLTRNNAFPEIESIVIDSNGLRFFDDRIVVRVRATDSSGGITGALLFTGDTGTAAIRVLLRNSPVVVFTDSFSLTYPEAGTWSVRLSIAGARGDTAKDTFTISTVRPERPSFALVRTGDIRPGVHGFVSGEPGFLQIILDDNDHISSLLSIDWGDGGLPESYRVVKSNNIFWHTYTLKGGDTQYGIKAALLDTAGILADTVIAADVERIYPPVLGTRLYFEPSPYCSPGDTTILIGVRILAIEDYVDQIVWIINENDAAPTSAFHLEPLGSIRGAVSDSGSLFVWRFPTNGFKGTNTVEIRVIDNHGNISSIAGNFYIAGKPGG